MKLEISQDDAKKVSVDRDGFLNDNRRQGFDTFFPGLTIHFEDEKDAEDLAKSILLRNGLWEAKK